MKKGRFFLLIWFMSICFFSCQKELDSDQRFKPLETPTSTNDLGTSTAEANYLKKLFKSYSNEMKDFLLTSNVNTLDINKSKEYILMSNMINDLKFYTLEMFRSYGLSEKDLKDMTFDKNEQQIVIMGLTFLAIQTSMETKEYGSENIGKGLDLSYGKVMDCIARAFLGFSFSETIFSSAGKIALDVAIDVVKRAAVRIAGVVGAIVVIIDFGDCIGLYDVW